MEKNGNGDCERPRRFFCLVYVAIAVVGFTSAESHSVCERAVENAKSSMSSMVGDTMSSENGVPFEWSPEYEVAVVYITSMWSEYELPGEPSEVQGTVANYGFLNYCVRFKNKLAILVKTLQDDPNESASVKNAVADWYEAVNELSRNDWQLPHNAPSLESVRTQFRTAFKHLVINGVEIYRLPEIGAKGRREVDDFTRDMAYMMLEILKRVSKQIRDVPAKSGNARPSF